jgi:protein-disulfide isomerase
MGNPDAPIKLVEYGSLSCPHCAKLAQDGMDTLLSKYVNSGRVSYEFRSYIIHGVLDLPMTVLVKCDNPQAFFPLVEQVYRNYDGIIARAEAGNDQAKAAQNLPADQRWPALADAFGLTDFFAARGLPVDQAHKCLANADEAQKAADRTEAWFKSGISSTPTLFINGMKMEDVHEWNQLEPALQRAGAR